MTSREGFPRVTSSNSFPRVTSSHKLMDVEDAPPTAKSAANAALEGLEPIRMPVRRESNASALGEDLLEATMPKVLVINTGGTIGMRVTKEGYAPEAGFMSSQLRKYSQFHDPFFPEFTLPLSRYGKRVQYTIKEYDPVLDSCNLVMNDWIKIACDIAEGYNDYDSFVVLHGTDTMAYTASALSFLLRNLSKTVIITGSQIPLCILQSDGMENLLGALTIAGHFCIPEVLIYFHNNLMRGNRCVKSDASAYDAFSCPNYLPLGRCGVEIQLDWDRMFFNDRVDPFEDFCVDKNLCQDVAILRIFPGMQHQTLRNFLAPPLKGCVLMTFGAGNISDTDMDTKNALMEASERGVIMVNVTQCGKGTVKQVYKTSSTLRDAGVVCGSDMTAECALTKLAYLIGRFGEDTETIKRELQTSIRGEMTEAQDKVRFSLYDQDFLRTVANAVNAPQFKTIANILNPILACRAAANGDNSTVREMIRRGVQVNLTDYDWRTPLHLAAAEGKFDTVQMLVDTYNAKVNVCDRWGHTPLSEAVNHNHNEVVAYLKRKGGKLEDNIAPRLLRCVRENDKSGLEHLVDSDVDINTQDYDGRTALHTAVIHADLDMVKFLVEKCNAQLNKTDKWGRTPLQDAVRFRLPRIIEYMKGKGATRVSARKRSVTPLLTVDTSQKRTRIDSDKGRRARSPGASTPKGSSYGAPKAAKIASALASNIGDTPETALPAHMAIMKASVDAAADGGSTPTSPTKKRAPAQHFTVTRSRSWPKGLTVNNADDKPLETPAGPPRRGRQSSNKKQGAGVSPDTPKGVLGLKRMKPSRPSSPDHEEYVEKNLPVDRERRYSESSWGKSA